MNAPLTPVQQARQKQRETPFQKPNVYLPVGIFVVFLLIPLVNPSFFLIDLAAKIAIFTVLVASFDIILGYTGMVSFAHSMFFGIGAYSVGLLLKAMPDYSFTAIVLAFLIASVVSVVIASLIALFSLRVKAIFFAMITLAFSELSLDLAIHLSEFTGGEDGFSIQLPGYLTKEGTFLGIINGQYALYYLIVLACTTLFWLMLRFTQSPVGRVLLSIRENESRSAALGYKIFHYQIFSINISCIIASWAGVFFGLWLGYIGPDATLSTQIMLNILVMIMIGGAGTLYGAFIGAAFLQIAQSGLPTIKHILDDSGWVTLATFFDRWLLLFGLIFIFVVFYFPVGILGTLKKRMQPV